MKLPWLFHQVHSNDIYRIWCHCDRPPYVNLVPKEFSTLDDGGPDKVTYVTVRCRNDRGTLIIEAASPADLQVIRAWEVKHQGTDPSRFS